MTVRYQTPIYECDMCAASEAAKDGPEGWLYIPPSLGRPVLHVCPACQEKPIRELALAMNAMNDGPSLPRRRVRP
jgi:hypothetical protein